MIARVQFKAGGGDGNQGQTVATGNFAGSATSGNLIIVGIRNGSALDTVTSVTDTLGTTYTRAIAQAGLDPDIYIYYGYLLSSGTNSVTANLDTISNYIAVVAVEVSGLATSSVLDTVESKTGSAATDLVSDAFSTNQADEYVFAMAGQSGASVFTAGADFTLIDGTMPTNALDFAGAQERITSGTLSSYTAHITSNTSLAYTIAIATFKGAPAATLTIIGRSVLDYD